MGGSRTVGPVPHVLQLPGRPAWDLPMSLVTPASPEPAVGTVDVSAGTGPVLPSLRWFGAGLLGLFILAIGMRVLFVIGWTGGMPLHGDPLFFQKVAASLAHGDGYAILHDGRPIPTALHPPMFPLVLAVLDLVGLQSADVHRDVSAFISAGGVPVMGLLGRRVFSPPPVWLPRPSPRSAPCGSSRAGRY